MGLLCVVATGILDWILSNLFLLGGGVFSVVFSIATLVAQHNYKS